MGTVAALISKRSGARSATAPTRRDRLMSHPTGRRGAFRCGRGELGGPALRAVLVRQGATVTTDRCDVSIRTPHADARVRELADFLVDEDFEGQFRLDDDGDATPLHRLTLVGPAARRVFTFDDSGVQDWAFVALLPQLDGETLEIAVLAPSSR